MHNLLVSNEVRLARGECPPMAVSQLLLAHLYLQKKGSAVLLTFDGLHLD